MKFGAGGLGCVVGFGVSGSGFRISDLGWQVQGLDCRAWSFRRNFQVFRVEGVSGVQGLRSCRCLGLKEFQMFGVSAVSAVEG